MTCGAKGGGVRFSSSSRWSIIERESKEVWRKIFKHIQTLSLNNSNFNHKRKEIINQLPMFTIFSETTEFSKFPNQTSYLAPKEKELLVRKKKNHSNGHVIFMSTKAREIHMQTSSCVII